MVATVGVFESGWTAEAAGAVVGVRAHAALRELAEHSLVMSAGEASEGVAGRSRFLEPIGERAVEMLNASSDAHGVRRRHAA